MKTDDQIRDALRFEPAPEPAFTDDFDAFRARARRASVGHAVTTAMALVVPLALLAGALAWIARGSSTGTFAGEPGRLTGDQIVDAKVGYSFRLPAGWKEALYDLPAGYSDHRVTGPDGVTLFISASWPRSFDEYVEANSREFEGTLEPHWTFGTVAGRRARAVEGIGYGGHVRRTYFVEWTNGWVLHLKLSVPGAARESLDEAEDVIASIAATSLAVPTSTRGTVVPGVGVDDLTRGVIAFLQARTAGKGAGSFLGPRAAEAYAETDARLNLYDMRWIDADATCTQDVQGGTATSSCGAVVSGDGSSAGPLVIAPFYRWVIRERNEGAREGRAVFIVELVSEGDEVYERYDLDRIVVERDPDGAGGIVVVDAREHGGGGYFKES